RFLLDDRPRVGALDSDGVIRAIEGDVFQTPTVGGPVADVSDVQLLAPCEPTKALCVRRNYKSNLLSKGLEPPAEPVVFLKAPNGVAGSDSTILRPDGIEEFVYEGELAVVIGRQARRVRASDADNYILGYTCANDLTVRDWQQ